MALVNGGFLHYMDMKKFLKNLLRNHWSDFEIISQECSLRDTFQKNCSQDFDLSINMALVNGSSLHSTDMKKFVKNLLRNHWSDFQIILQESGFDISRCPDCPIRAVIAMGKLPSPLVSPLGK